MLTDKHIHVLQDWLFDQGISNDSLMPDLIDHLACLVENHMRDGKGFHESFLLASTQFSRHELLKTQESTLFLLSQKNRTMKLFTGWAGIFSALLIFVAVLFKVLHFPGANIGLVSGLSFVAIIVLPCMAYIGYDRRSGIIANLTTISVYLAGMALTVGGLFKIMHWPYATFITSVGFFLLCLIFLPLYFVRSYKLAENKVYATSKVLLILAGVVMLWGLMP
jgi:hypothetical protein